MEGKEEWTMQLFYAVAISLAGKAEFGKSSPANLPVDVHSSLAGHKANVGHTSHL